VPIGVVGRTDDGGPALLARMLGVANGHRQNGSGEPRGPSGLESRAGVIEIDLPDGARIRVDALVDGARAGAERAQALPMIQVAPGTKVHLACRPVSMRYGFDGLAAKVASVLDRDPFSGHLFCFRSKRGDYLKILYWDGSGLCLFAKRLERGRFVWPPIVDGGLILTPAQLALLLEAIVGGERWRRHFRRARRRCDDV
jgi:transposase